MNQPQLYHPDWNPASTFNNATSWGETLASGSFNIVAALIGVPMTESRMGRSRGRVSLVRIFAPVGVFGFLAVLKVHLASIVDERTAKELNLAVNDMASASRLGSIRHMNTKGVNFGESVDILETRTLGETSADTFVRRDEHFTLKSDIDVSHVSTRQRMEVLRHSEIIKNNRERLIAVLVINFTQAIFIFGITLAAEYAASRQHSVGLIYAASVVVAEITTGIIEWLWTSKVSGGSVIIGLHDEIHDNVQGPFEKQSSKNTIKLIRIFEQKIRDQLYEDEILLPEKKGDKIEGKPMTHRLRHYKISRKVQLTMSSITGDPRKQWLISSQMKKEGKIISKASNTFYFFFYYSMLGFAVIALLAETLAYVLYISSSFINGGQNSIKFFGQWFAVQIVVFLIKGFSPLLDRLIRPFREPTDKGGYSEYGNLYAGDQSTTTGESALRGHVRAIHKTGVLIQSIEHRLPQPSGVGSFVLSNSRHIENEAECVVPQILVVNGTNVLSRLEIPKTHLSSLRYDGEFELSICRFEYEQTNREEVKTSNHAIQKQSRKAKLIHVLRFKVRKLSDTLVFRIIMSETNGLKEMDIVVWDSKYTSSFPVTISSGQPNLSQPASNQAAGNNLNPRPLSQDAPDQTIPLDSLPNQPTVSAQSEEPMPIILSAQSLYFNFAHVNDFDWPKVIMTCLPSLLEVSLPNNWPKFRFRPNAKFNIHDAWDNPDFNKDDIKYSSYPLENTYIHPHHELSESSAWLSAALRLVTDFQLGQVNRP